MQLPDGERSTPLATRCHAHSDDDLAAIVGYRIVRQSLPIDGFWINRRRRPTRAFAQHAHPW
jgi:hypothetical protein